MAKDRNSNFINGYLLTPIVSSQSFLETNINPRKEYPSHDTYIKLLKRYNTFPTR